MIFYDYVLRTAIYQYLRSIIDLSFISRNLGNLPLSRRCMISIKLVCNFHCWASISQSPHASNSWNSSNTTRFHQICSSTGKANCEESFISDIGASHGSSCRWSHISDAGFSRKRRVFRRRFRRSTGPRRAAASGVDFLVSGLRSKQPLVKPAVPANSNKRARYTFE